MTQIKLKLLQHHWHHLSPDIGTLAWQYGIYSSITLLQCSTQWQSVTINFYIEREDY